MLRFVRRWRARRTSDRSRVRSWHVEELEPRLLLTTYTPAQISQAYGLNQIMFGSVKGDGTGQTIAIVDAYDAPNVATDLQKFDAAYGLSNNDGNGAFVLTKATPQGTPSYNAGWAQEITLDVEWAHAIAPGAHILLVEAKSSSYTDLLAAVDYARNQPGVSVVSMSWGGTEFSGESAYDSYFTTPSGHAGVSFVASAGDTGAVPEYPAVSPNVLSVGGTTLTTLDSSGTYGSETTWTSSGGGISAYEPKPTYQSSVTQSSTRRTTPDVAYDANPSTGVAVYFTGSNGSGAWYTFGGTSIGAPQWAALIAIANQGRALIGQGPLDGPSQLLPAIYNMPSSDFHDITQGTSGSGRTALSAGPGYDLVTGRGSPYANLVVRDLVNTTANGTIASSSYVGSLSVAGQIGTLTYGTAGASTYTVTVNRGTGTGAFDVNMAVTAGLPAGSTWYFTVGGTVTNTLHFNAADNSLTVTLTVATTTNTPAGSSTFTVKAERIDSGGNLTGDLSTGTGSLVVNKRVLTVSAAASNRVYDGTTAATVTFADDRVAGDVFTVGYGSAAFSDANAGSGKTVTVGGLTLSGAGSSNYTLAATTITTTANITARPITATADAKTKVIGSADPPLTWQLTAGTLVSGDGITGTLTRVAGEGVGTYDIQQGTLTAGNNYALTFVGNTLTILPGYDLSGPWTIGGQLTSVSQSGLGLSFVDQNGVATTGTFTSVNQITGRNGLTATIDTSAADDGRILWSDGTVWLRISIGGQYYNPANNGLTAIIQNGTQLTFVNVAGGTTAGTILGPNHLTLPGWGQTGTWIDGLLSFSGGSTWRKLDLSPDYRNVAGDAVHVYQNGTLLTFVNKTGGTSAGKWISPTQVQATDWNVTGTVANGQILWSNGTVWNKNLSASGTTGTGTTSIAANSTQIILTNASGGTSRAQITAAGTLVALDWGNLTGTRSNGRIVWSDGTIWGNFDFNALDAVFADIRTYPFGS